MHLIHTHSVDIHCSSQDFGNELHRQLGYLLEKEFYPKLELLFEKYEYQYHTWSIDLLDLQLPKISKKNWKYEIINQSLNQIEEYLKNNRPVIHSGRVAVIEESYNLVMNVYYASDLFFKFLRSGVLIENSISNQLEKVLNEIEVNEEFIKKLMELFENNSTCLIRWIFSVPDYFKVKVINLASDFPIQLKSFFLKTIKDTESVSQKFFKESILTLQWIEMIQWADFLIQKTASKNPLFETLFSLSVKYWNFTSEELIRFFSLIETQIANDKEKGSYFRKEFFAGFKKHIREDNKIIEASDTVQNESEMKTVAGDIYFITNAGLIIFHPFLKSLFEQLGLCENEKWKDTRSWHKAILLTQYLITGQVNFFENELILNKILCGFPIEGEVNTKLIINKEEKEKCHSLLQAVLEHWKTMSSSSIEALRETFLQREGKLDLSNPYSYELWVEEKGVDILMAQLPWGIGMIKTPWMENHLTCNWN